MKAVRFREGGFARDQENVTTETAIYSYDFEV